MEESDDTAGPSNAPTDGPQCTTVQKSVVICGAKTRSGEPCQKPPLEGRTRCRLHGGASLAGTEHGRFKHGMYAKAMPKNLRRQFDSLMNDPALLEGRAEVSLLQIRLAQLTARLGTNESGASWLALQETFRQFTAANQAGDHAGQLAALTTLNEIIDGKVNDEAAWKEATEFVEKATKVAEREWKRVIANRSVATAEQVRMIVHSLTEAVLTYVTDTRQRQQIADHVNRLRVIPVIEPVREPDGGG